MGGQNIDNNGESEFEWVGLTDSEARGGASSGSQFDSSGLLARAFALLLTFRIVLAETAVLTPAASAQNSYSLTATTVAVDSHNGNLRSQSGWGGEW